jgi:multidrug resistance efflux pump
MLEVLLCSLFTVFPDYLYRRYAQGKRFGREINVFSVWFELRYGITACLMLSVLLIAVIFYHHPSSSNAKPFFRAIPIVPEQNGRVAEVYVSGSSNVEKGAPLFKLDSSRQEATLELAKKRVAELDAAIVLSRAEVEVAVGQIQQAKGAYEQARDELDTKIDLRERNANVVPQREIERLQKTVESRLGAVTAAEATKNAAEIRVSTVLPAQKASAEATLAQAQVDLDKAVVYAGVDGRVEQFVLRVGDIVNPFARPAGVLIPAGAGRSQVYAGFNQIEAQVMKVGMIAEITCVSKPLTIIPMVVTSVQQYIATGQLRATDQLLDAQQLATPGTIAVALEPLFKGGLDGVTPGSNCIANAYSNNHDLLSSKEIGFFKWLYLHMVDAVAVVHAMLLRVQALVLPIKTLVLSGH